MYKLASLTGSPIEVDTVAVGTDFAQENRVFIPSRVDCVSSLEPEVPAWQRGARYSLETAIGNFNSLNHTRCSVRVGASTWGAPGRSKYCESKNGGEQDERRL